MNNPTPSLLSNQVLIWAHSAFDRLREFLKSCYFLTPPRHRANWCARSPFFRSARSSASWTFLKQISDADVRVAKPGS